MLALFVCLVPPPAEVRSVRLSLDGLAPRRIEIVIVYDNNTWQNMTVICSSLDTGYPCGEEIRCNQAMNGLLSISYNYVLFDYYFL